MELVDAAERAWAMAEFLEEPAFVVKVGDEHQPYSRGLLRTTHVLSRGGEIVATIATEADVDRIYEIAPEEPDCKTPGAVAYNNDVRERVLSANTKEAPAMATKAHRTRGFEATDEQAAQLTIFETKRRAGELTSKRAMCKWLAAHTDMKTGDIAVYLDIRFQMVYQYTADERAARAARPVPAALVFDDESDEEIDELNLDVE